VGLEIRTADLDAIAVGDQGLPAAARAALDEVGWAVVPSVLPALEVDRLWQAFDDTLAADPGARTKELGTRSSSVAREDERFAVCWRHLVVLEAAAHVLGGRFEVGGVDLRDPETGHGIQRHHPDHGDLPVPGITATWFIDAFTEINGPTLVVPGTHRRPPPGPRNVEEHLPGEVAATGPAGSVLLRDARLFHAGSRNRSFTRRRATHVFLQHEIPDGT
jgi:hypothetical protein